MTELDDFRIDTDIDDAAPRPLALDLATKLIVGAPDAVVLAWIRAGLLRWCRSDGTASLSATLHLGATPRAFRLAMRDLWLREGAACLSGTPWQRSVALQAEIGHFLAFRWPSWRKHDDPPAYATRVEHCLFAACLADENLPTTATGVYRVIASRIGDTPK